MTVTPSPRPTRGVRPGRPPDRGAPTPARCCAAWRSTRGCSGCSSRWSSSGSCFNVWSGGTFLTPRNLWNLSVQTVGRRDHGHRHGAGHRVAQHRPVGRLDAGRHRHGHGDAAGRVAAQVARARRPTGTWIIALAAGLAHGGGDRGASRARSSRTSGCRRSSSPWAGCWSGAVWPGRWPRAAPSRRWTPTSSCWAAAASTAASAAPWTWIAGRRRLRGHRGCCWPAGDAASRSSASPCARSGPTSLLGVVECGAVLGTACVINCYPMPPPLAREYVESQRR